MVENPFSVEFPEPGEVAVSDDGETWFRFPCDPETLFGCAGVTPTAASPATMIDPTDPVVAGGDAFDLEVVGLERARYLRITDVSAQYWKARGLDFCDPGQNGAGGFDLDAIALVDGDL